MHHFCDSWPDDPVSFVTESLSLRDYITKCFKEGDRPEWISTVDRFLKVIKIWWILFVFPDTWATKRKRKKNCRHFGGHKENRRSRETPWNKHAVHCELKTVCKSFNHLGFCCRFLLYGVFVIFGIQSISHRYESKFVREKLHGVRQSPTFGYVAFALH